MSLKHLVHTRLVGYRGSVEINGAFLSHEGQRPVLVSNQPESFA